jgi:PAS domain-containing protein
VSAGDGSPPLGDARVRAAAQRRLEAAAQDHGRTALAGEALTTLHALAIDPARQGDALALLHELRVHQDEIELQHEELEHTRRAAEREREDALRAFEAVPVALVGLSRQGRVLQGNAAAVALLCPGEPLTGSLLRDHWPAAGRAALEAALQRAWAGSTEPVALTGGPDRAPVVQLRATRATIAGEDTALWLALWTPAGPAATAPAG